jgi:hypothetical protein
LLPAYRPVPGFRELMLDDSVPTRRRWLAAGLVALVAVGSGAAVTMAAWCALRPEAAPVEPASSRA